MLPDPNPPNKFLVHAEWYTNVLTSLRSGNFPASFAPKPSPWFPQESERCIEVPWALSRYRGQKSILEIGLSLADITLVSAQLALKKIGNADLHALDIVDIERVLNRFSNLGVDVRTMYRFALGDVRNTPYADNSFDLIFLISTIEHVGFDEFEPNVYADTVFKRPEQFPSVFPIYEQSREDRKVLKELKRILAPRGSILLTVPMGKGGIIAGKDSKQRWGFSKEYTSQELTSLLQESGLSVVDQRFFCNYDTHGWVEKPTPQDVEQGTGHRKNHGEGVACAELMKEESM